MMRVFLVLLAIAATLLADRAVAEFRLRKDPTSPMRGWIVDNDDAGFTFERFGRGGRTRVRWDDLVEADAKALRVRFGLDQSEDERKGLVPGHVITFKGGGELHGLLERVDDTGRHWVRSQGMLLPYPGDRIDRVEEAKIAEEEIYSADEVYARRLERTPPRTAVEHRRLADYLFDIGSFEGAHAQYDRAIEKDPTMRGELEDRLAELRDYEEDEAAGAIFSKAKKLGNLDGRYSDALALVRDYVERYPGARRRGFDLIEQLEQRQLDRKQQRFHRVKNEEFDRSVRRFLATRQPDLATARSWVTSQLPELLKARIADRLELSGEEWDLLSKSRSKASPHFASYWAGSFIVSKRAAKGKSTKRAIRGDPETWWQRYNDVTVRSSWLEAYAAERLPDLFEVVYVRNEDCDRCGGTGRVRKMSLKPVADGRHEWQETCPRCFGSGKDRSVAYR